MKLFNHIKTYCGVALLTSVSLLGLNACSENIDESDLYTFTGETLLDHLDNHPEQFSYYATILGKVTTSKRSSSTVRDLLAARGNYTCFAPTNTAVQQYLDSLCAIGQLTSNAVDQISDSVAQALVFNSIIQHGENTAYATTDFSAGALSMTNMNDRYISISYATDADNNKIIFVNKNSKITEGDIEVENGFIHVIDKVLSPSNEAVAGLILQLDNAKLFSEALSLTGWDDKAQGYKDEAWEEKNDDIRGTSYNYAVKGWNGMYPDHRYVGYTIFLETDEVFAAKGITDLASLKEWVRNNSNYDDDTSQGHATSWGEDYTNDYNWLNQFVAYHILPEALTYNNMVTFANEYGRYAGMMADQGEKIYENFYVNVWEYWETVGVHRRPLKITGCRVSGAIQRRINRYSVYNNGFANNYQEKTAAMDPNLLGAKITSPNDMPIDNDAFHAFFYTIDDILIWNDNVSKKVLNERMRYDITSLFPEFLSNNIRQNRDKQSCGDGYWFFPTDYLENVVDMSNETKFIYLPNQGYSGASGSWMNYQIDEFNINGVFDFTMKLPPVPYTGTYEIRYGINSNDNRGMAQIYIGTNKYNLPAVGIPLDLRQSSGTLESNTGWVKDGDTWTDEDASENTKSMRNMGFMKGPKYIQLSGLTGRGERRCLRKIIYTGTLEAGKTYYIRFKSALSNSAEFFFDYLEFVPKTVYAGEEAEDVW